MTLTNEIVEELLGAKFLESEFGFEETYGMLSVTIAASYNLKVLQYLYDNETLRFRFLTDLTAVHYPERVGEELCIVYHLHNMIDNVRLRVKLYVPIDQPNVFTLTTIFSGANWMERETYDFFGVNFVGHPNLIRILNVDEMTYFPMRKEYPMEDPSRRDKDDEMFGRGGSMVY